MQLNDFDRSTFDDSYRPCANGKFSLYQRKEKEKKYRN